MAYTQPTTRNTGDSITASVWNTDIVDNIIALKNPPSAQYTANEAANWTTTSTSFVDVDGTDLSLAITTTGGDVMIGFHGNVSSLNNYVWFDVTMDGTRIGTDDGFMGIYATSSTNIMVSPVSFVRLVTNVAAGSHTFKLQWKASAGTITLYAGAGTANGDVHPQFWVREVS